MSSLIDDLLRPDAYPEQTKDVTLAQTHISNVFICDDFVYKVKKPVDFGFLDFSTLELRKHFCHQEVMLNRIDVADVQNVDHQTINGATSGLAPDTAFVSPTNNIPDHKKVTAKTELFYGTKLFFETLLNFGCYRGVLFLGTIKSQLRQVIESGFARWQIKAREVQRTEL